MKLSELEMAIVFYSCSCWLCLLRWWLRWNAESSFVAGPLAALPRPGL